MNQFTSIHGTIEGEFMSVQSMKTLLMFKKRVVSPTVLLYPLQVKSSHGKINSHCGQPGHDDKNEKYVAR